MTIVLLGFALCATLGVVLYWLTYFIVSIVNYIDQDPF